MNEADQIRKEMIETGQPRADLTVYKHCRHCDHGAPHGGGQTLTADGEGHTEPCGQCQTWTTAELQEDFKVLGFAAPYVVVQRKSDGKKGTLQFSRETRACRDGSEESVRIYFGWREDTP